MEADFICKFRSHLFGEVNIWTFVFTGGRGLFLGVQWDGSNQGFVIAGGVGVYVAGEINRE